MNKKKDLIVKSVIGDVHGCYETLIKLYDKIKDTEVYSVGDIVDKGPNSALCLDFVIENGIKVVKGNHERFFEVFIPQYLDGINIKESKWYTKWGGDKTIESYKVYPQGTRKKKMLEHLKFIKNLPYYYIFEDKDSDGNIGFVTHGFALPYYKKMKNNPMSKNIETAISCNRLFGTHFDIKERRNELLGLGVFNIFGHDAFEEVYKDDLFYGIDTGCTYGNVNGKGGKLTAIIWNTKDIISVDVLDETNYKFDGE